VFGAINLIASCLPSYFVLFGLEEITSTQGGWLPPGAPPVFEMAFRIFPYAFIAAGIAAVLCGVVVGLAMLLAGYCLAHRTHFVLCQIALLPEAFIVPAGTALALFTLLTMRDRQVRPQFERGRNGPLQAS
jgi:hypothetical protein